VICRCRRTFLVICAEREHEGMKRGPPRKMQKQEEWVSLSGKRSFPASMNEKHVKTRERFDVGCPQKGEHYRYVGGVGLYNAVSGSKPLDLKRITLGGGYAYLKEKKNEEVLRIGETKFPTGQETGDDSPGNGERERKKHKTE